MPEDAPEPSEPWASRSADAVLTELDSAAGGLTAAEARARLERDGPNTLRQHRVSALAVFGRQFRNAILLMLLATAAVAAALGDTSDAVIIAIILTASTVLGFTNEYAAERASARLQESLSQRASVLRDGVGVSVPSRDLVRGDVVELSLGARVPADLRLVTANHLAVDEAVVTGESLPVEKSVDPVTGSTALGDLSCLAFMGTVVTAGSGTGVVVATGTGTEMGRIAVGLGQHVPETAFQAGLRRFSVLLMWFAAALVALIVVSGILLERPLIDSVLFALAIAVGITPQLLPAVVNSSLAFGARRLARERVLVKRLVCIEDLGNISVLVTDKTGTLTRGTMSLETSLDPAGDPDPTVADVAVATVEDTAGTGTTDALDAALAAASHAAPARVLARLPFDHERLRSSALVATGSGVRLVCKGAPEAVLAQCVGVPDGAPAVAETHLRRGARVIAVATRDLPVSDTAAPRTIDPADETAMTLVGFLCFADPPREDAPAALDRLAALGIRVVVATGDHPAVAADLAGRLGIAGGPPLTGAEIDALDDDQLTAALAHTSILARVSPHQKQRAVGRLRAAGETVGFLGDGVNDALALHGADVGISVDSATDVAKDAADIILLEKSLGSIADGVSEGRRIFANTLKYVYMSGSGNFGNMLSAAVASVFLPFLPMLPGQILLGNLLYDASQLTISGDRVDAAAMRRPAKWDIGAIGRFMLVFGAISSLFDLITFATLRGIYGADAALFHSGWFVESLCSQALVVLVIRTRLVPFVRSRPSVWLAGALTLLVAIAVALPFSPVAGTMGFVALPASLLAAIAAIVVSYLIVADTAKLQFHRLEHRHAHPVHPHHRVRALRRAAHGFQR